MILTLAFVLKHIALNFCLRDAIICSTLEHKVCTDYGINNQKASDREWVVSDGTLQT